MIEFTYIAKRSLKAGVTAGDVIVIEINVTDFAPSLLVNKSSSDSLGGRTQQNLLSYKKTWAISTFRTDGFGADDWQMFVDSVVGGELFDMVDYDTGLGYSVQMTGSYSMSRITNFNQSDFKFAFTVKEA